MSKKAIYQLSARQIVLLAFASALIAVGTVACISNFGGFFQLKNSNSVAAEDAPTPQGISNPTTVSDEQNSIEVYKSLSPGVAFITTSAQAQNFLGDDSETEKGNGSGSVIDAQGHILTNYHVIEGATKLSVSFGGEKTYPAKLVGGDPDTDLAVIQIEPGTDKLTVVQLGDSDQLEVGQKVLAIGNPFGLDRTLTTGVISGLQRPIRARNGRTIEGAIQTDASINPGNSGGPLLDKFGRMIGINSQILAPGGGGSVGVGFAVPINIAKRIVPQLIQFGEVRRPKLGAALYSVEQLAERGVQMPVAKGVLIRSIAPGGSAASAGLRGISQDNDGEVVLGDIITSIDGTKVADMDDVYKVLDKKQIGDTIQVEIYRGGKSQTIALKLMPLPASVQGRPPVNKKQ
jgi:S1-C subfamily serine protease